jgi:hypothetical protein
MQGSLRRFAALAAVTLVASFAVTASTASAHGREGVGLRVSTSTLVTRAAQQLNVTRARLVDAITAAALTRINAAAAAGQIEADDVDEYREEARENLRFAIGVSRTRTVAANLSITVARLNNGFRAARKALILARINEALADGDITGAQAADLKEELDDVDLPGYKSLGYGLGGHGR